VVLYAAAGRPAADVRGRMSEVLGG